jgi:hypothetical protein
MSILLLCSSSFTIAQTFNEIENSVRANAALIGADKTIVGEIIRTKTNYKYGNDEFINGKIVDKYYNPDNGSALLFVFDDLPWDQFRKCLLSVNEIFYYPNDQLNALLAYFDNRTVFKKTGNGEYQYVAFSNALSNIMTSCGYSKVIMKVNGSIDNNVKNKYSISVSMTIVKN